MKDLNLRPLACEASALTTELIARSKSGRDVFSRWVGELQTDGAVAKARGNGELLGPNVIAA
jgi:hypothetical protein